MNKTVKKMYKEMLMNSIVNHDWSIKRKKKFSVWEDYYVSQYESESQKVGRYTYFFLYTAKKSKLSFSKEVKVLITEDTVQTDTLTFSIFSNMYWRLLQMERDYKNNATSKITNFYIDVYKAFKEDIDKKSIEELEESLRNLEILEAQHKEKIAKYEKRWEKAL